MSETLNVFRREGDGNIFVGTLLPDTKCPGFFEGVEYLIGRATREAVFYVDDAPLPLDTTSDCWVWRPGFYAGEVAAEIEYSGSGKVVRYVLDVSPSSAKTGREQYLEYVEEVLDYAPQLLLGTEPATHNLGGRSRDESPWIRYARLRCFVDRYHSGLKAIANRPCIRQKHYREQLPIHLARRVDSTSVRRLSSNPALINALVNSNEQEVVPVIEDNRIDIPFSEPSFDNPANRVILQQLRQVLQLTEGLLQVFSEYKFEVSETETDIQSRLPRRITYLKLVKKQLNKIARNEPFSQVSMISAGVAGLNSVSGLPHYDMTHRLGLKIIRKGLSSLTEDERHYLPPTWHVFESWCFVKLARGLESRHPDFTWRLNGQPKSAEMLLEGNKGSTRIRLYSQLNCPALMRTNRYGYCSISKNRIPDFVLEYFDGSETHFVCLDSKYMVSRASVLDAMASAHIYRDSIKYDGNSPALSVLITPASPVASELEAADYIGNNKVGVIKLERDQDVEGVLNLVWEFLVEGDLTVFQRLGVLECIKR